MAYWPMRKSVTGCGAQLEEIGQIGLKPALPPRLNESGQIA